MTDTITLTGLVATDPKHNVTSAGLNITNFRLASTQRRFDRTQNKWVDGETNWYSISTFRQLAVNAATSVHKGDRVVLTGRLRLRDWQTPEKSGMNIDIEADALGHDLSWGTARWARTSQPSSATPSDSFPPPLGEGSAAAGDDESSQTPDSPATDRSEASGTFEAAAQDRTAVLAGGGDDTPF